MWFAEYRELIKILTISDLKVKYQSSVLGFAWSMLNPWSEPLRVDNELSNGNSWRESHEKDQTALRPRIQDISSSRA